MNEFKALTAFSTLGVTSLLNRTGNSTQVCLIDSENDASFDKAILSGPKRAEDVAPVAISPVGYDTAFNDVMAAERIGRMIYSGQHGMTGGPISLHLHAILIGTPRRFINSPRKEAIKTH